MTAKGILISIFAFVLGAAALAGEERRMLAEVTPHEVGTGSAAICIEARDAAMIMRSTQRDAAELSGYSGNVTSIDSDRLHCEPDHANRIRVNTKQVDVTN